MRSGAHLIQLGKTRDFPQMTDAAGVHDRRADVVDQLLLDELLAVEDRVEDFADRERRRRVLADQPEALLQFRRSRIFQPEEMVRLEVFAETGGFNRRQAMMDIVQQMHVPDRTPCAVDRKSCGTKLRYRSVDH